MFSDQRGPPDSIAVLAFRDALGQANRILAKAANEEGLSPKECLRFWDHLGSLRFSKWKRLNSLHQSELDDALSELDRLVKKATESRDSALISGLESALLEEMKTIEESVENRWIPAISAGDEIGAALAGDDYPSADDFSNEITSLLDGIGFALLAFERAGFSLSDEFEMRWMAFRQPLVTFLRKANDHFIRDGFGHVLELRDRSMYPPSFWWWDSQK